MKRKNVDLGKIVSSNPFKIMCIHPKSSYIRRGPDLSTLNVSMRVFCERYFLTDQHFDKRFLDVGFKSKKPPLRIGDMTVEEFTDHIKPKDMLGKRLGLGKRGVQKIKDKLAPLGIMWE